MIVCKLAINFKTLDFLARLFTDGDHLGFKCTEYQIYFGGGDQFGRRQEK